LLLLDAGALNAEQRREAGELLGHLNEVWFGYRSGDHTLPALGEPRAGYDPEQTTPGDRIETKAAALGCSVSKLYRKHRNRSASPGSFEVLDQQRFEQFDDDAVRWPFSVLGLISPSY
jgi:hypothetical protein